MKLEKLKILVLDEKKKVEKEISALFNPTKFTIEDSSTWQDFKKPRLNPELQYISGARKTLSMELFFDTYESGEDVRKPTGEIAKLLVATLNDNGHGKRPPTVRFSWGKADPNPNTGIFVFEWVLEKLTQNFTLFNSGGVPVRATLNVSFKEFVIPKEEIKHKPRRKSFPAQTYTLKTGDTLSGVAADLWNDSSKWRIIAVENKIDNPRLLQTGQTLIIPNIK